MDPYLESVSSELYIPPSHPVPPSVVKAVWAQLLKSTETTDWHKIYKDGQTKWELHPGMVSTAGQART